MTQVAPAKDSATTWIKAILIWAFLAFWCVGMLTGLMASSCRKVDDDPARKLSRCNLAISTAWIFPSDGQKGSIIHLERGIAQAQIGNLDAATVDMQRAILDARPQTPSYERLADRIAEFDPSSPEARVWTRLTEAATQ
ncbi:hypothetical protein Q4555_01310 [Octadecabacter sp. 1_MG-2023]|uniref:hypothetical protein n=1 Tax=unclassified Octadecabacter TaxID=196158 RepID=UPI001C09F76B|nr:MULTISPECIES: hypothetical protein [unclassified Octadecabacter]MBU2993258.1 hypothetical protein [Octadecabacter sp. B2R22]MDO6733287.1 hypothetical protein [Octadecabacter sp. 1_MG-2023]